jgi:hypothetical protein
MFLYRDKLIYLPASFSLFVNYQNTWKVLVLNAQEAIHRENLIVTFLK